MTTGMQWPEWAAAELQSTRSIGRWRSTRVFDAKGPRGVVGGREVVSFASNDYLGLSSHPAVEAAAIEAIHRWGAGATASRLVVGTRPCHEELEREIAEWKQCDSAILFPTGYAANLATLSVFGGPEVTVFSDELNHASIIDGCRLGRSHVVVYRHLDVRHLESLLATHEGRKVVVSDSVFSMDGDVAPIDALGSVCARRGALLVLDEAHGVLDDRPTPTAEVDIIRIGTLSKSLGSLGGWVSGSSTFIDLLLNRARPYIFTTGLSPADTSAALAALRIVRSAEGEAMVARLRSHVHRLRPGHPSPIVPIVLGEEGRAMKASADLLAVGVFVPAIRPPTVPVGTSRLRVALSAAHDDGMIELLIAALDGQGLR